MYKENTHIRLTHSSKRKEIEDKINLIGKKSGEKRIKGAAKNKDWIIESYERREKKEINRIFVTAITPPPCLYSTYLSSFLDFPHF